MCIAFLLFKLVPRLLRSLNRHRFYLFLLILVLLFTLFCLSTPYNFSFSFPFPFNPLHPPPSALALHRQRHGDAARYLTYLPHSGLSAQHTQLTNALLLAAYTNRTLALPPAFLGYTFTWSPYPRLLERVEELVMYDWPTICGVAKNQGAWDEVQEDCERYERFAIVPWSTFYDFSALKDHVQIVEHSKLSLFTLRTELGLVEADMQVREDVGRYAWMVYDSDEPPQPSTEGIVYQTQYPVSDFLALPHRLLHLYSVGSPGRVTSLTPEHAKLRTQIQSAMVVRNPILLRVVAEIVALMGGAGRYIGVYIEWPTGKDAQEAMKSAVGRVIELLDEAMGMSGPVSPSARRRGPMLMARCVGPNAREGILTPVFLATDHPDPRSDVAFVQFFGRYPCAFVMEDLPVRVVKPLEGLRGEYEPEKRLAGFVAPVVATVVAGRGKSFIEVPKSGMAREDAGKGNNE